MALVLAGLMGSAVFCHVFSNCSLLLCKGKVCGFDDLSFPCMLAAKRTAILRLRNMHLQLCVDVLDYRVVRFTWSPNVTSSCCCWRQKAEGGGPQTDLIGHIFVSSLCDKCKHFFLRDFCVCAISTMVA